MAHLIRTNMMSLKIRLIQTLVKVRTFQASAILKMMKSQALKMTAKRSWMATS